MITLEQAKEKLEDLKSEIRCRLKCEPEDLEIVQHESGCISIYWVTKYIGLDYMNIHSEWIVVTIDWKEKRASMFADPSDFMVYTT